MISNPKYKGYYVGNKVRIVDMFTKKQKFLPPEEWVMFKDESGEIVPASYPRSCGTQQTLSSPAAAKMSSGAESLQSRQSADRQAVLHALRRGYYRRDAKDRKGSVNSKWSARARSKTERTPALPCRCTSRS